MNDLPNALDVLDFWWLAGNDRWFRQDDAFDAECRSRFLDLHVRAAAGERDDWMEAPHSALALIIVLDQFSRNIFRGTAEAFAQDEAALAAAETALERGYDRAFPNPARTFIYMPFQHSEDIAVQARSVDLFRLGGDKESYHYALIHYHAIDRFGRFPHRNAVLGRETTEAERRYLETGGFFG